MLHVCLAHSTDFFLDFLYVLPSHEQHEQQQQQLQVLAMRLHPYQFKINVLNTSAAAAVAAATRQPASSKTMAAPQAQLVQRAIKNSTIDTLSRRVELKAVPGLIEKLDRL